ncbi:hypothetical protein QQG55_32060 [Brugia pahangi]
MLLLFTGRFTHNGVHNYRRNSLPYHLLLDNVCIIECWCRFRGNIYGTWHAILKRTANHGDSTCCYAPKNELVYLSSVVLIRL